MDCEPSDVMVLGAIRRGARKFGKIQKATKVSPEELDKALEDLEKRGLIKIEEKKTWLGKKVELHTTKKGDEELERSVHEMQQSWDTMVQVYKSGDKKKMKDQMDGFRGMLPMMMFFGVMDMMMFSMMFSMMGSSMTDYVPADQIPEGADAGSAGDEGGMDGGVDSGMDGGGGFDFDLGF